MSGIPLPISPLGQEVQVVGVRADEKVRRHLENLGLLVGERVTLLSERDGDLIIRVRDSRIALNKGVAMRIFVVH